MARHIKHGDTVLVISGEERGSTGKVLQIVGNGQRAIVEGLNLKKKHLRKSQDNPEGAITDIEMSIHISNLKPIGKADED